MDKKTIDKLLKLLSKKTRLLDDYTHFLAQHISNRDDLNNPLMADNPLTERQLNEIDKCFDRMYTNICNARYEVNNIHNIESECM
jgi:hypothetical protein